MSALLSLSRSLFLLQRISCKHEQNFNYVSNLDNWLEMCLTPAISEGSFGCSHFSLSLSLSLCVCFCLCVCVYVCLCHMSCAKWVEECFWYSLLPFWRLLVTFQLKTIHISRALPPFVMLPPVAAGMWHVARCKLRTSKTCWLIWPSLDLPNYFAISAAAAIRKWRKRCNLTARFSSRGNSSSSSSCHKQVAW